MPSIVVKVVDESVCVCVCVQYMAGTVGPPLPSTDMRLEAVPEMSYDPTGNPPRGEIMFKGPSVFSGYYKDQEKTAEVGLSPPVQAVDSSWTLSVVLSKIRTGGECDSPDEAD